MKCTSVRTGWTLWRRHCGAEHPLFLEAVVRYLSSNNALVFTYAADCQRNYCRELETWHHQSCLPYRFSGIPANFRPSLGENDKSV